MGTMKYVKRKTPTIGSQAAAEIVRLLKSQEPPLGYAEAARMIGVNPETMRSIMNDSRVPSAGVINGLARSLELSDKQTKKLFQLRDSDKLESKIQAATGSSEEGAAQFASVLALLSPEQQELLKKQAVKLALANKPTK